MKHSILTITIVLLIFFYLAFPIYGDIIISNIELGIERLFGYTQYQIGGIYTEPDGTTGIYFFPVSELKFPIDVYMFFIN